MNWNRAALETTKSEFLHKSSNIRHERTEKSVWIFARFSSFEKTKTNCSPVCGAVAAAGLKIEVIYKSNSKDKTLRTDRGHVRGCDKCYVEADGVWLTSSLCLKLWKPPFVRWREKAAFQLWHFLPWQKSLMKFPFVSWDLWIVKVSLFM